MEIIKNLELKNNDKIKEIQDITKVIKSQRQPKILKEKKYSPLLHLGNTQNRVRKCKNKRCGVCDVIIERKILYLQKPKNKTHNKDLSYKSKNVVYIIECNKC